MKRVLATGMAGLVLGLAGCATQQAARYTPYERRCPEQATSTTPKKTLPAGEWKTVGTSNQGRPIRAWQRGEGSQKVVFLGCVHGDEVASRKLLEKLVAHLECHPELLEGKKVVVVPVANPDGFAKGTRVNGRGVDLNRNFPTNNYKAGGEHGYAANSEPETRALCSLIREQKPEVILTLHGPLECVDYDGPAMGLANRVSKRAGLPVKQLGARPGSLGSYAGVEQQIPTITLELPGDRDGWAVSWERMGPALLEVMKGQRTDRLAVDETPTRRIVTLPGK